MKKLSIFTCTMIALGFMATTVRADSAHYIKGPTASLSGNDYCVSFKEAGLGSTPVTYTITSDATFTWQCFTKSNNTPQGSPNSVSFPHDTNSITVQPHNGQITGEVCLTPEGSGNCQGHGLVSRLIGVCYTNVTFTDTATGQTFNLDDMSSGSGCP